MPKSLRTKNCVCTKVFRRIVQQLKNDPEVRRVVGDALRSWEGVTGDKDPFVPSGSKPVVRVTPQPESEGWFSPDSMREELVVVVELGISSLCIDDVNDLYDLIVQALQPGGKSTIAGGIDFAQDLVQVGAETGEILFANPAYDPQPAAKPEACFFATGRFKLDILRAVT
jgi:hypothetical protein